MRLRLRRAGTGTHLFEVRPGSAWVRPQRHGISSMCRCGGSRSILDIWGPYLQVIAARAGQAVHILDRFHIMAKMNKAIDEVRASEARQLQADGDEPLLKHSRWCLLKQPGNLSDKQFTSWQSWSDTT
ncbi:MAG TPA: transposase [Pyrinomonadaceae bacterium]|nr:transposase [Pyrinomonadaceae bacterium]